VEQDDLEGVRIEEFYSWAVGRARRMKADDQSCRANGARCYPSLFTRAGRLNLDCLACHREEKSG